MFKRPTTFDLFAQVASGVNAQSRWPLAASASAARDERLYTFVD